MEWFLLILKLKTYFSMFIIFTCCIFLPSCNNILYKSKYTNSLPITNPNLLKVHYIDVGQGDCELIQINNKNMLIDAGPADSSEKVVSYLKKCGVSTINFLIETHPHEDHIGGMKLVLDNFSVKDLLAPKIQNFSSTSSYKQLLKSINSKKLHIVSPAPGYLIDLSPKVKCEVLGPAAFYYEDLNNYSIVLKVVYNNCKFLFMGDAQTDSENQLLSQGFDLSCNVLKVGHHGSKTASSTDFLSEASPNIAIISCGRNNEFGHPHKTILDRYKAFSCKIFRTDFNGDIVITADGTTIKTIVAKK